jgi:hypothetical protein
MTLPKLEIYAMKDNLSNMTVKKRSLFDLPMRLLIVGKSQLSGKSTLCGNLLCRPYDEKDEAGAQFYEDDFEGENIFVVSPSVGVDRKWASIIKGKEIPDGNIYHEYDEESLERLYDKLEMLYYDEQAEGKIKPKLVIFDDCSFSGAFKEKMNGIMAKFFCNSRHFGVSVICTSQKLSDLSTVQRENATGIIMFACSNKQAELFYNDVGTMPKKEFMTMLNKATCKKHSFMVVNYSNDPEERFLNSNFQLIE